MSYSFVFTRSIVLTIIVGLFLLALGRPARQRAFVVRFWAVALGVHLIWLGLPYLHSVWGAIGRWLVSAWIAALLIAVVLIIPFALYRIVRRLLGRRSSPLTRVPLVFVGLSLAIGIAVSLNNLGDPVVREEVIDIAGLPEGLDGLRIANVGDIHIGRFIVPEDLARAVDIVNDHNVDLMAVTGDLIDDLSQIEPTLDALERSKALPILSILGNHDKYPNEAAVVAALRRRNPRIQLLVNEGLTVSPRGTPLRVVGVDYAMAPHGGHMLPRAEQDAAMRVFAERAFTGSPPGETIVALSHHPEFFPIATRNGAVLTLASHTHGGQISFFGRPLIVAYDYMQGLYREGGASLDVSAGVGHWLPVRIGVPREISIITLRRQRVEATRLTQDQSKSSNINVCALMRAKPGQESNLRSALMALAKPTRGEDGFMIYNLYEEADGAIFLYEAWRSQEDLDRHLQKPYVQDFIHRSPDWLNGANDAHFGKLVATTAASTADAQVDKSTGETVNICSIKRPKPGKAAELRGALEALVTPTRSEEGHVTYNLFEEEDGSIFLYEVWRSQADLEKHFETSHVQEFRSKVGSLTDRNEVHFGKLVPVSDR